MRAASTIGVVGLIFFLCGCATPSHHPDGLVGTWSFDIGEMKMVIRLDSDGHWAWRSPDEVSPSAAPTQSGRWFVLDGILVLRVEQSASDKLPPGIAFTYDLRRVLADQLILFDRHMEREKTWTRTANQRVETNRRPASPFHAGRQFESASCAPPFPSAAVAHLWR